MYLCKELSKDNNVEIITSDFNHARKTHKGPAPKNWPFKITFLHEPGYRRNISIQRFISHRFWGKKVGRYLKNRKNPDVVYCAVPSLTAAAEAVKYCNNKHIKSIIDIQDLWPEAFRMVINVPLLSSLIFLPFTAIANSIYKNTDEICAVSCTYVNRALVVNRKCKHGHVAFLGTSIDAFDNYASEPAVMEKPQGEIWLGYCGGLTSSYDIGCVLKALNHLKTQGCTIPIFIVMGDGEKRSEFEDLAKELNVDARFVGKLPYNSMCSLINRCDIVVNPIAKGSAASIINKHGDYASSGKPVINTQDSQEYIDLINEYDMGINCTSGDYVSVAEAIQRLVKDNQLRLRMGANSRKCAEEKFDRKNSYKAIIKCICE